MIITTADAPAAIGPYVQGVNLPTEGENLQPPSPPFFAVPPCSFCRHYTMRSERGMQHVE